MSECDVARLTIYAKDYAISAQSAPKVHMKTIRSVNSSETTYDFSLKRTGVWAGGDGEDNVYKPIDPEKGIWEAEPGDMLPRGIQPPKRYVPRSWGWLIPGRNGEWRHPEERRPIPGRIYRCTPRVVILDSENEIPNTALEREGRIYIFPTTTIKWEREIRDYSGKKLAAISKKGCDFTLTFLEKALVFFDCQIETEHLLRTRTFGAKLWTRYIKTTIWTKRYYTPDGRTSKTVISKPLSKEGEWQAVSTNNEDGDTYSDLLILLILAKYFKKGTEKKATAMLFHHISGELETWGSNAGEGYLSEANDREPVGNPNNQDIW